LPDPPPGSNPGAGLGGIDLSAFRNTDPKSFRKIILLVVGLIIFFLTLPTIIMLVFFGWAYLWFR